MIIKIHNTLSGEKENFEPVKHGHVGMYHCGPTVYDRAHIGNLRSYVFADTLRRIFEYAGYNVHQVINITDVGHLSGDTDDGEDKMSKALRREGLPMTLDAMCEIGDKYKQLFLADLKSLNILPAHEFPMASDNINEDIGLIELLTNKGYAYRAARGICFDTSKFSSYGKLGNIDIDALRSGSRVGIDLDKRNATDFWLWKFDDKIGWNSPWGMGFPGWHIECSVMSRKFLGQPFDIHTGGIDHIPVHHNNEIAQSEAAYGIPLAKYWMHNEFVILNNIKMAKSLGNIITLDTIRERTISPVSYRYWLLTAHYRSPVDFSFEALDSAQTAYHRLRNIISGYPAGGSVIDVYKIRFEDFVSDDVDMPKALALTWELAKDDGYDKADTRATVEHFDTVFGLDLVVSQASTNIPENVLELAKQRDTARLAKDWVKADILRQKIVDLGYEISDKDGTSSVVRSKVQG